MAKVDDFAQFIAEGLSEDRHGGLFIYLHERKWFVSCNPASHASVGLVEALNGVSQKLDYTHKDIVCEEDGSILLEILTLLWGKKQGVELRAPGKSVEWVVRVADGTATAKSWSFQLACEDLLHRLREDIA